MQVFGTFDADNGNPVKVDNGNPVKVDNGNVVVLVTNVSIESNIRV